MNPTLYVAGNPPPASVQYERRRKHLELLMRQADGAFMNHKSAQSINRSDCRYPADLARAIAAATSMVRALGFEPASERQAHGEASNG